MSDRAGRYWRTGQLGKNSKQTKVPILQTIMPVVIGLCEPGWLCLCWAPAWLQDQRSGGTGPCWEHRDRAAPSLSVGRGGHGQDPLPVSLPAPEHQGCEEEPQPICHHTRAHPAALPLPRVPAAASLLPKGSRGCWAALVWIGLLFLFFQELGVINQGR